MRCVYHMCLSLSREMFGISGLLQESLIRGSGHGRRTSWEEVPAVYDRGFLTMSVNSLRCLNIRFGVPHIPGADRSVEITEDELFHCSLWRSKFNMKDVSAESRKKQAGC